MKKNNMFGLFKSEDPSQELKEPDMDDGEVSTGLECDHKWELIAKTYAAPIRPTPNVNIDPNLLQKIIFGVTTYMWQCKYCGIPRKEEMLGSDENRLEDILDKVDTFGMQYVKERGKVYGVAQWVPEVASLPVETNGQNGSSK